jgi:hypothetical protein
MLSKMIFKRTAKHAMRLARPGSRAFVPNWSAEKPRRAAFSTAAADL